MLRLDFRDLKLSESKLEQLIVKKAKPWLDSGRIFGAGSKRFVIGNTYNHLKKMHTVQELVSVVFLYHTKHI